MCPEDTICGTNRKKQTVENKIGFGFVRESTFDCVFPFFFQKTSIVDESPLRTRSTQTANDLLAFTFFKRYVSKKNLDLSSPKNIMVGNEVQLYLHFVSN